MGNQKQHIERRHTQKNNVKRKKKKKGKVTLENGLKNPT